MLLIVTISSLLHVLMLRHVHKDYKIRTVSLALNVNCKVRGQNMTAGKTVLTMQAKYILFRT